MILKHCIIIAVTRLKNIKPKSYSTYAKKYDDDEIPIRITTNRHYEKMHRKIFDDEKRFVFDNPKVKYQGDCVACHEQAWKGEFSEKTVKVPGFAKSDWE